MTVKKTTRRRGSALDQAILGTAWEELLDHGYANFTMEAVAKRAGTSRSVLSRRWPTRGELATAAITHYLEKNPISIPDLGSVREELAALLQTFSERGLTVVTKVLFSLRDYFVETNSSLADLRGKLEGRPIMEELLERGVHRGEIDPGRLTSRIASLPLDLLRHEVFMSHKPVPATVIAEILDTIFLPLVGMKKADREPHQGLGRIHL